MLLTRPCAAASEIWPAGQGIADRLQIYSLYCSLYGFYARSLFACLPAPGKIAITEQMGDQSSTAVMHDEAEGVLPKNKCFLFSFFDKLTGNFAHYFVHFYTLQARAHTHTHARVHACRHLAYAREHANTRNGLDTGGVIYLLKLELNPCI